MKENQNLYCDIQIAKAFFIELNLSHDVKTKYAIEDEDSTYIDFSYIDNSKKINVSSVTIKEFKDNFYSAFKFKSPSLKLIENAYNYSLSSSIDLSIYNLYNFNYKFNILDFISSRVIHLSSDSECWKHMTYKVSGIIDNENIMIDIYMKNVKIKSLFFSDILFKTIPFRVILSSKHLGTYNDFDLNKIQSALENETELNTSLSNGSYCFKYKESTKYLPYSNIILKGISKRDIFMPAHEIFSNQMRNSAKINPVCEEIGSIYNGIYKFCENKNIEFTDDLVQ